MWKSLSQEFYEAAAAAYREFPGKLAKLVVMLPDADTPVFVAPLVAGKLTRNTQALRNTVRTTWDSMRKAHAAGLSDTQYDLAGTEVNLIALDTHNILGAFSSRYTREMRAQLNLYHELGHYIVRNGLPVPGVSKHKAECAADAFAMLWLIRRYGKNTDGAGFRSEALSATIILNSDMKHYTSDAIQRAIAVADEWGPYFSKFSLHKLAELAAEIADKTALEEPTLNKIRVAYLPVAQYCQTHLGQGAELARKLYDGDMAAKEILARQTIGVMENPKHRNDPDIIKAGKRFLNIPPLKEFITAKALTGDKYWQDALALANAPVPASAPQPMRNKPPIPGLTPIMQPHSHK